MGDLSPKEQAMKRHNWKMWLVAVLAAGTSLAGCQRAQPDMPNMKPPVTVVVIQPQHVVMTSELPGRTTAYRTAEIRPQVNGLIQKRLFTEGSRVQAGDVLYEVDPAPYEAAYNNAAANVTAAKETAKKAQATLESSIAALQRYEAVLKLAKVNRERHETLMKKHAVSAMEYDQAVVDVDTATANLRVAQAQVASDRQSVAVAKASIQQAEAALQAAKINLDYTKITAPIAGRIGRSTVTDGAIATAYQSTALTTIQQMDPIYVDVPQSTVQLLHLKRSLAQGRLKATGADKVKIILEDGTVYPELGSLQFADVTVDETTGSVILRVVVPNRDNTLLPNMYVRAVIEEGVREDAILVPQQAVTRDPKGNPMALVVDDADKVELRPLVADRTIGNNWLVSSGLAKGDRVIVEGAQKVRPGAPVQVVQTKVGNTVATNTAEAEKNSTN